MAIKYPNIGKSREERALHHKKGFRPKVTRGVPSQSEGFDGEIRISNTTNGLKLYVRYNNQWFESSLNPIIAAPTKLNVNAQYAHFGYYYLNNSISTMAANNHYAIPFMQGYSGDISASNLPILGTSTDPATSLTVGDGYADSYLAAYWYVPDDITIDKVDWFAGADASSGDTFRCHVMKYDLDKDNSSTSGDLSSGVVVASSADIASDGYGEINYNQMTINSANVNAHQVVLFTFRNDSVNSDYSISATVKYHLR